MLTKKDKEQLRSIIFRHLDGIAVGTTAFALYKKGVIKHLQDNNQATLSDLTTTFNANEGYLNVALRILCSQGWLIQHLDNTSDEIFYEINENSETAFKLAYLYEDAIK